MFFLRSWFLLNEFQADINLYAKSEKVGELLSLFTSLGVSLSFSAFSQFRMIPDMPPHFIGGEVV